MMSSENDESRILSRRAFLRRFAGEGLADDLERIAAYDWSEREGTSLPGAEPQCEPGSPLADTPAHPEALRRLGVSVSLISGGDDALRVRAGNAGMNFTDDQMSRLEPLADSTVWLDLGKTAIGDEGLAVVARMKKLRCLYLQQTRITDAGLRHVAGLEALHYLNLYDTDVSDEGLRHLHGLHALRSLFVWQTRVTTAGVEALVAELPDLEVNIGAA